MAQRTRVAFTALKALGGLSIPQENFPEAATQTFKQGAPVVGTAGYLGECGADPALVLGIASRDGQNGATAGVKNQSVYLAHPTTLFKGVLDNGLGTYVSLVTDILKAYGIAKHAGSGRWYVDTGDTTATRVVVWDFWDGIEDGTGMVVGDTMMHVVFQFGPTHFQGSVTA